MNILGLLGAVGLSVISSSNAVSPYSDNNNEFYNVGITCSYSDMLSIPNTFTSNDGNYVIYSAVVQYVYNDMSTVKVGYNNSSLSVLISSINTNFEDIVYDYDDTYNFTFAVVSFARLYLQGTSTGTAHQYNTTKVAVNDIMVGFVTMDLQFSLKTMVVEYIPNTTDLRPSVSPSYNCYPCLMDLPNHNYSISFIDDMAPWELSQYYLYTSGYVGNLNSTLDDGYNIDNSNSLYIDYNNVYLYYSFSNAIVLRNADTGVNNLGVQNRINLKYCNALFGNDSAWENGYSYGYNDGRIDGREDGYNDGYDYGYDVGYDNGYEEGMNNGADYTFGSLFGAVADTPILIVRNLFNFDFFGVNMLTVVLSLFTALILFYLIRKLL